MPPGQRRTDTFEVLGGRQHVFAESVGIGERRLLVKHAALDAAAQVLDKVSVDLGVDIADDAFGIDLDARVQGSLLRASYPVTTHGAPAIAAANERRDNLVLFCTALARNLINFTSQKQKRTVGAFQSTGRRMLR